MPRNNQNGNQRGSNNNNAEGRNQYSYGMMERARERPFAAATVAAATVGAGVFLWSRRNQISEQLSTISDQLGEWGQNSNSGSQSGEFEMAGGSSSFEGSSNSGSSGGMASSGRKGGSRGGASSGSTGDIGGGNASMGSSSGSGMQSGGSGGGRA
jgi:hypothetical protein